MDSVKRVMLGEPECGRKSTHSTIPGLKPGVCSGLKLSGAFYPDLKIGVWRRRTYQITLLNKALEVSLPKYKYLFCFPPFESLTLRSKP